MLPTRQDLNHTTSFPPWRPGKRIGHTNTEEASTAFTQIGETNKHMEGERDMIACKLGREGEKRRIFWGDDDPDQRLDEAPTAWGEREREVPGQLMVKQRKERRRMRKLGREKKREEREKEREREAQLGGFWETITAEV